MAARPARADRDPDGRSGRGRPASGRVSGVCLVDGTVVPADVVVVGIGADPAVEWLDGSGLDLSAGVVCYAVGATSAPGIWAVGDCSAWYDAHRGRPHRVEHWTDSRDRPAVLARTMLGRTPPEPCGRRTSGPTSTASGSSSPAAATATKRSTVEAGSAEGADLLAVYRRAGEPVAVLGMNQPSLFMRYRKALPSTPVHPLVATGDAR